MLDAQSEIYHVRYRSDLSPAEKGIATFIATRILRDRGRGPVPTSAPLKRGLRLLRLPSRPEKPLPLVPTSAPLKREAARPLLLGRLL